MLERSVPCFFSITGKAASRKLAAFQMVADAIAADALACTGFITAIAGFKVFFFFTLHVHFLSQP
jgi:hypothetical protein